MGGLCRWIRSNHVRLINGFLDQTPNKPATIRLSAPEQNYPFRLSLSRARSLSTPLNTPRPTTATSRLKPGSAAIPPGHLLRALPPPQSDHCQLKKDIFSSVRLHLRLSRPLRALFSTPPTLAATESTPTSPTTAASATLGSGTRDGATN